MIEPAFLLTPALTPGYRHLLWQTFFAERQRGFALEDHIPQTAQPDDLTWYGVLQAGQNTVAGLMLRKLPVANGLSELQAAALGMVCVAAAQRGQGLSTLLLEQTMTALALQGINAFTLWTSKPAVYRPLGFSPADLSLLVWVSGLSRPRGCAPAIWVRSWPDAQEIGMQHRGLPPFALGAQRLVSSDSEASAVLLADPSGLAVAEWCGHPSAVADLLAGLMPPKWRLHARAGDALLTELARRGAEMAQTPTSLQMWRAPGSPQDWTSRYALRLLDRI